MEPFIGEIRAFPFEFAPRGWINCDGAVLNIRSYTPLFSIIGNYYGGDGQTTFAVPNLQGRAVIGAGAAAGRPSGPPGTKSGHSAETLTLAQLPPHHHDVATYGVTAADKLSDVPSDKAFLGRYAVQGSTSIAEHFVAGSVATDTTLAPQTIAPAGEGKPHDNMQPYLTLRYCIAIEGVFPMRA